MPTKITFNDFRGGMIDKRMRRRSDMQGYYNSASLIENAVPSRTGGIKLRPGIKRLYGTVSAKRLISFIPSTSEPYVVALSDRTLEIYTYSADGSFKRVGEPFSTKYTSIEIDSIQYTQDYDKLVLVHRNHPPLIVQKSTTGGFIVGDIILERKKNIFRISDGEIKDTDFSIYYDYDGLFTEKDYPSACAFMSNRLWFMASKEHPYRFWASRPFEYNNFQFEDYIERVDESVTTEEYLKAMQGNVIKTDKLPDGGKRVIERKVNADGTIIETISIYDKDGNLVSQDTRSSVYTEPKYSYYDTVREDCALYNDVASDRNENIFWIGYGGNGLYIGTSSSEWVIPSDVSAINASVHKLESYGSAEMQCIYGGNALFYVQSGRKRIMAITISSGGLSFNELTFHCESITDSGIKAIAFQRVPDARLYAVLEDGTLAINTYDAIYGVQAWSKWTSNLKIVSMCIIDTEKGQVPIVLYQDEEGNRFIGEFSGSELSDDGHSFKARIVTNNIEGDGTIPYVKKSYNLYVDSNGTRFTAGQEGTRIMEPRGIGAELVKLDSYSTSPLGGLRIEIDSVAGEPFEVLALGVQVEIS